MLCRVRRPFESVRSSPACLRPDRSHNSFPCSRARETRPSGYYFQVCASAFFLLRLFQGRTTPTIFSDRRHSKLAAYLAALYGSIELRAAQILPKTTKFMLISTVLVRPLNCLDLSFPFRLCLYV